MEAFKINQDERKALANVFITAKLLPDDIQIIILAYAGLMRITNKHVCWTIYNAPPFFYKLKSNGKKSLEQTRYVYLQKKQKSRHARRNA